LQLIAYLGKMVDDGYDTVFQNRTRSELRRAYVT
jgi:hypothetical protein